MQEKNSKSMGITVIGTESLISIRQERPPLLAESGLSVVGTPQENQVQILVAPKAFSVIHAHAHSDLETEVGGFLIGRPYVWEGRTYVEILEALPAEITSSSAAHLTISPDTWARAQTVIRDKYAEMYIVGWYHTHPRMSVFLSGHDLTIHEGFFQESWHVSLVLEPSRHEAGFFAWMEKRVDGVGGYWIHYPENTPAEEHWRQGAQKIYLLVQDSSPTLKEFYEDGCWHTRWIEPDEIVVKVRPEVVGSIGALNESRSGLNMGLCWGRVRTNMGKEGPLYFVEVTQVDTLGGLGILGKLTRALADELQDMATLLRDKKRSANKNQSQKENLTRVVGWYVLDSQLSIISLDQYTDLHKRLFRLSWQVGLFGTPSGGLERCVWHESDGKVVLRPLIERVALTELTAEELPHILNVIRDALAVERGDSAR
jgi:proteasome lid subunit RPN8/RPN11